MNAAIPEVLRERGNELMLGGLYDVAEAELVEEWTAAANNQICQHIAAHGRDLNVPLPRHWRKGQSHNMGNIFYSAVRSTTTNFFRWANAVQLCVDWH